MTHAHIPAHLNRFLGDGALTEELVAGVELWRYERPEFVSFATHGLSELDVAAVAPQELVCSVQHGQDGAAAQLVRTMLDMIIDSDRGPVVSQLVPGREPILDGTDITGLLASVHPYLNEPFNALSDEDGNLLAQIVTLIPVTADEVAQAESLGVDALEQALEDADPPLLNVLRAARS